MFSITVKRSAVTLGVVAGSKSPRADAGTQVGSEGIKAVVVLIGANDYGFDARHTQASLGRENSIECITLCHEGFEIC
jgi:hypothetical protein